MVIAGICLSLTVVLINVEVVGRYIFNYSTLICDEYSGYLFSMLTMFGLVFSLHRGQFLRVTFLVNRFSPRIRSLLLTGAAILGCVFSGILCYQVGKVPYMSVILGTRSIGSDTPIFIFQTMLPVGMGTLTMEFFNQAMKAFRSFLERGEGAQS